MHKRHNDLRGTCCVAGDVSREVCNIWDNDGATLSGCRAAHTTSECNAQACGLAVERTQHEFRAVKEVESRPVYLRHHMVQHRGRVGGISDEVIFSLRDQAHHRYDCIALLVGRR